MVMSPLEKRPLAGLMILAAIAAPTVFGWLLKMGGRPLDRGTAIHYPMRPMIRALVLLLVIGGTSLAFKGMLDIRGDDRVAGWTEFFCGLAFAVLSATSNSETFLDEVGLHSKSRFFGEHVIPWAELEHFETSFNRKAMTTVYYFRSSTGRTIAVSDSAVDVEDLLDRIHSRQGCPQQTYKRRKWYGG